MDWGGLVQGIAGMFDTTVNLGFGIYDRYKSNEIDKRNYANQLEEQQYAKDLQNRIFEREDNMMQRKRADYENAGFSPWAAIEGSGGGGTGQEISRTVPERARPSKLDVRMNIMDIMTRYKMLERMDKENNFIEEQTKNEKLKNEMLGYDAMSRQDKAQYDIVKNQQEMSRVLAETQRAQQEAKRTGLSYDQEKADLLVSIGDAIVNLNNLAGDASVRSQGGHKDIITGSVNAIISGVNMGRSVKELEKIRNELLDILAKYSK